MSETTSRDSTAIAFDRLGAGAPVIVIGGATCERQRMRPISAVLAESFEVINYDRRGRGESGDTQPYSVDREIEDVDALIGEVGGSAHVYGHSSGAALALRAAAAGLSIERMVVHDPPFTPDAMGDPARVLYSEQLEQLLEERRRGDAIELFMTLTGMPTEMLGAMRIAPTWPGLEALAPSLAYDSQVMGDRDRGGATPIEMLKQVRMPVLALSGGMVPDWMKQAGVQVAEHVCDGRHAEIPDAGHAVPPEKYAPMAVTFFNQQAPEHLDKTNGAQSVLADKGRVNSDGDS